MYLQIDNFVNTVKKMCWRGLLIYLLYYLLTHSLTHPPTHSLTHSPTHQSTHPLIHSLTHSMQQNHSWGANWFSQSRNSPHFMEPEGSLLRLQVPATCTYPESDQSIWCPPPSHFLKIHLNIILCMQGSSKGSFSPRFPHQNPACMHACMSPHLHMCYLPLPSHSSWFDHSNNIWWGEQIKKLLII